MWLFIAISFMIIAHYLLVIRGDVLRLMGQSKQSLEKLKDLSKADPSGRAMPLALNVMAAYLFVETSFVALVACFSLPPATAIVWLLLALIRSGVYYERFNGLKKALATGEFEEIAARESDKLYLASCIVYDLLVVGILVHGIAACAPGA